MQSNEAKTELGKLLDKPTRAQQEQSELKTMMTIAGDSAVEVIINIYTDERIPPALAAYMRQTYEELLKEGFSDDQALRIISGQYQNTIGSLLKGTT